MNEEKGRKENKQERIGLERKTKSVRMKIGKGKEVMKMGRGVGLFLLFFLPL